MVRYGDRPDQIDDNEETHRIIKREEEWIYGDGRTKCGQIITMETSQPVSHPSSSVMSVGSVLLAVLSLFGVLVSWHRMNIVVLRCHIVESRFLF